MTRIGLVLAVALFLLAGFAGSHLANLRRVEGIPMSAARVPLGGFEPLAVSFLWMRAEEKRAAGRLPEAVASYRLVTELSPRVGQAWALSAHLLIFTESSNEDPKAQWRWIREGLSLLKRGLDLNPRDPGILGTLGLAYYHLASRDEAVREVAFRELGRMPEELAVEAFRALRRVEPGDEVDALLTDSIRLHGHRLYEAGENRRALAAYEEILPRLTAIEDPSEKLRKDIARIRLRIPELRVRTGGE